MIAKLLYSIRWKMLLLFALSAGLTALLLLILYTVAWLSAFLNMGLLKRVVRWVYYNIGQVNAMTIVGVIVFVVCFLVFSGRTIRRMAHITEAVQHIADGRLDYRIPVRSQDELGVLAANINRMAERLHHSIGEERRAERTKAELITNVSHDLRTPLTSITGYLGLIEQDRCRDEVEMRHYVNIAYEKSQRMRGLIDDLFEYTRTSGGMKLHTAPIDLIELLGQIAAQLQVQAEHAGMQVRLSFPEQRLIVEADGDKLVRVFENLLTNAFSYGREGRYVDLSANRDKMSAVVAVTNYGEAIPLSDLPHLFERFYRVEKSRAEQTGGSGLGLAIARNIVELHGGAISVTSDSDRTRFEVRLPLR